GLRVGDVIIAIDSKPVYNLDALVFRISSSELGKPTVLDVYRSGKLMDVTMLLQPAPEQPSKNIMTLNGPQPLAGAVIGNLSPAHAIELGMPAFADGVVVTSVNRGSIAERYGLKPRDILLAVNGQKITEVKQAQSVLLSEKDTWEIQIRRKGRTLSFRVSS
ncbi:MAG: PDZ domain-containing protein, partial [Sneathiella sp.]